MMRNFWYINIILVFLISCCPIPCLKSSRLSSTGSEVNNLMDTFHVRKFEANYSFKELELTGILICKKFNDGSLSGSFMNEFGIKGFDFTIRGKQITLNYMVKQLNKWYIRNILKSDMHFLFGVPSEVQICIAGQDTTRWFRLNKTTAYAFYGFGNTDKLAGLYHHTEEIVILRKLEFKDTSSCFELIHTDNPLKLTLKELK